VCATFAEGVEFVREKSGLLLPPHLEPLIAD